MVFQVPLDQPQIESSLMHLLLGSFQKPYMGVELLGLTSRVCEKFPGLV